MTMNLLPVREALQNELITIYGTTEAMKKTDVILPAFLNDFFGMLNQSSVGQVIRESYRTEDEKVTIALEGMRRTTNGTPENYLTKVICNDRLLWSQEG